MFVFVTVGSTRFDSLIQTALSIPVLSSLRLKGYSNLVIQCGNSEFDLGNPAGQPLQKEGIDIEIWPFKPTLQAEYERADLVISHAGLFLFLTT